jgi:hypothetical protein
MQHVYGLDKFIFGAPLMISSRAVLLALTLLTATPLLAQPAPSAITTREQGQLVMQNVPVTPADMLERLIQDFTPDGGILIATRFGDTPQIQEVKMPAGARTQLRKVFGAN